MDVFKKLLAASASKLSAGQRTRLQWNDGSVCCLMDSKGENLYCVVTSLLAYPERLAYQLLYDLVAQASQEPSVTTAGENGLNQMLQPKMKDLVLYYEDANNFPKSQEGLASLSSSGLAAPDSSRSSTKTIAVAAVVLLLVIGSYVLYRATAGGNAAAVAEESAAAEPTIVVTNFAGVAKQAVMMI